MISLYQGSRERWGMYTRLGDRNVTKRLNTLIKKLNKTDDYTKKLHCFGVFIKSYSKVTSEASDTDVREQIYSALQNLAKQSDVSNEALYELWETYY